MKKNYIVKLLFVLFIAVAGLTSCKNKIKKENVSHQHEETTQQYTCPMHPQVVKDKPGNCPICGMTLVPKNSSLSAADNDTSLAYLLQPVNEQVIATIPTVRPQQGERGYQAEVQGSITYDTRNQKSIASRVGGRIERLFIKYNYQPVKKGQLIMEIYSPELAAAQRELLFIKRTGNEENMLQGAKQRLMLLGMNSGEIDRILRTGKISYRVPVYSNADGFILEQSVAAPATSTAAASMGTPSRGGGMNSMGGSGSGSGSIQPAAPSSTPSPVLIREGEYVTAGQSVFTIYQTGSLVAEFALNPEIAAHVKKNANVVVYRTGNKEESYNGTIGLIQPTFNKGENFTIARVYLKNTPLSVGELVVANIPVMLDKGWWVPKEAVVSLGNMAVVFKKEGRVFVPKQVKTGLTVNGQVQVMDNISTWDIASNASYLVDSESFIKVQQNNKQ